MRKLVGRRSEVSSAAVRFTVFAFDEIEKIILGAHQNGDGVAVWALSCPVRGSANFGPLIPRQEDCHSGEKAHLRG